MTATQLRCAAALQALGPKPPWWRVFARREWMRKAVPLTRLWLAEAAASAMDQIVAKWNPGQWQGLRVVKDEEVN